MNEREEAIRADVFIFRSVANLDATIYDRVMTDMGMNLGLISEKNQAVILHQIYDGIAQLATRLGNSWDEALMLTRATAAQGSSDPDTQRAYERLLRQTNHLYGQ